MPIEIYWLVENRVGFCRYIGDITVEEIRDSVKVGVSMMNTLPEGVALGHTIIEGGRTTSFPRSLKDVNNAGLPLRSHPKMGWTVTVGIIDKMIAFIANMISQITRTRSRNMETVEEAIAFLNRVDPTLPDLSKIDLSTLKLVRIIEHHKEPQTVD